MKTIFRIFNWIRGLASKGVPTNTKPTAPNTIDVWGIPRSGKTIAVRTLYRHLTAHVTGYSLDASESLKNNLDEIDPPSTPKGECDFITLRERNGREFVQIVDYAGEDFQSGQPLSTPSTKGRILVVNPFTLSEELAKKAFQAMYFKKLKRDSKGKLLYSNSAETAELAANAVFHCDDKDYIKTLKDDFRSEIQRFCEDGKDRFFLVWDGYTWNMNHQEGDSVVEDKTPQLKESDPNAYAQLQEQIQCAVNKLARKVASPNNLHDCCQFLSATNGCSPILLLTHLDLFDYLNLDSRVELQNIENELVKDDTGKIRTDIDGKIIRIQPFELTRGEKHRADKPLGLDHLWRAIQNQLATVPPASLFSIAGRLTLIFLPIVLFSCLLVWSTLSEIHSLRHRSVIQVPPTKNLGSAMDDYQLALAKSDCANAIFNFVSEATAKGSDGEKWKEWKKAFGSPVLDNMEADRLEAICPGIAKIEKNKSEDTKSKASDDFIESLFYAAWRQDVSEKKAGEGNTGTQAEPASPVENTDQLLEGPELSGRYEKIKNVYNEELKAAETALESHYETMAKTSAGVDNTWKKADAAKSSTYRVDIVFSVCSLLLFFCQMFTFVYFGPQLFSDLYTLFRNRTLR